MTPDQVRVRAEEFIARLHRLEEESEPTKNDSVERIVALFAQDAHLTNAALRLHREERAGRNAIQEFWKDYKKTVGVVRSEFHQITVSDTAAGLFWTTSGGENSVTYDGATLLVFTANGEITRFSGYYDTRQFNQTLGIADSD